MNSVRNQLEEQIKSAEQRLKEEILKERLAKENIDVTVPANSRKIGSIHPITGVIDNIKEIFLGLRI